MNEDFVFLGDIIDNRESDPETYEKWGRACREQLDESIERAGPIMVPEHGLPFHVKFRAEEVDLVKDKWPYTHIDWRAAAEEQKYLYDTVVVDGITYYFGGDYFVDKDGNIHP